MTLGPALPSEGLAGVPAGARVVVAMSGGVDSSVTAALLKAQGYDVVGVTLQLYSGSQTAARKGACCAGQDIRDARRVADQIGIPHFVFDYEARFREAVIASFAESYIAGETPIPCVTCNQTVKFTDLLAASQDLGAAALATGHYVEWRLGDGGPELYRAADPDRDQSYFLFATTRAQLAQLRFPLGGLPKRQVRALAAEFRLPVAEKPDSQDICFVPSGRYADIIERLRPDANEPGEIVHVDGRVLGEHTGILHFTIGQRRRLGIASAEPLFVLRLDAVRRQVVVGPRACLHTTRILLRRTNWLGSGESLGAGQREIPIFARVRSTRAPQPATLSANDWDTSVLLHEGEQGVAAGQACVFYADGSPRARVLGGGFIASAQNASHEGTSQPTPGLAPRQRAAASG